MLRSALSRSVLILATLCVSGCGLYWNHAGPELSAYDGTPRPENEVAIIDQGAGCWSCVTWINSESKKIYSAPSGAANTFDFPNKIMLLPGTYYISLRHRGRKSTTALAVGEVNLLAGRTYNVEEDTCFPIFCWSHPGYTSFVWMEDADTGEVVLGKRM